MNNEIIIKAALQFTKDEIEVQGKIKLAFIERESGFDGVNPGWGVYYDRTTDDKSFIVALYLSVDDNPDGDWFIEVVDNIAAQPILTQNISHLQSTQEYIDYFIDLINVAKL